MTGGQALAEQQVVGKQFCGLPVVVCCAAVFFVSRKLMSIKVICFNLM